MSYWRPIVLRGPQANDVLGRLTLRGLKIELDEQSHTNVIQAIETFLDRYQRNYWSVLITEITGAIRRELLKSRNVKIDFNLVRQVVEHLSNGGVEKKKEEEQDSKEKDGGSDEEDGSDEDEDGSEEDDSEGRGQDSEDEEESDQDSEEESEEEEVDDSDSDDDDDEEEVKGKVAAGKKEETEILKVDKTKRQKCIEHLLRLSREQGMGVKEGDEEAILDLMIPYIRDSIMYSKGIMIFLRRVREHIDRCTSLTSVETVKTALKRSIFDEEYADFKIKEQTSSATREEDMADANKDQLNQPLKKNLVPTKEEGIATPMDQLKQEETRDSGDIMEIEEQETSKIPMNLPEQSKESMGNAYSCIKESLERAGGSKRKLAQV